MMGPTYMMYGIDPDSGPYIVMAIIAGFAAAIIVAFLYAFFTDRHSRDFKKECTLLVAVFVGVSLASFFLLPLIVPVK